jgi:hypothetical protein
VSCRKGILRREMTLVMLPFDGYWSGNLAAVVLCLVPTSVPLLQVLSWIIYLFVLQWTHHTSGRQFMADTLEAYSVLSASSTRTDVSAVLLSIING